MGFEELTCPSGASARHRCVLVGCQYGARMDPEVSTKSTTRWPVAVGAVVLAWLLWVMARLAIAAGDGVVCPAIHPAPVECASPDRVMFAAIVAVAMNGVFAFGAWRVSRPSTKTWMAWTGTALFAIVALAAYRFVLFQ